MTAMLKIIAGKVIGWLSYVPLLYLLVTCFTAQVVLVVGLVGWLSFQSGQQAVSTLVQRVQQETNDRILQELTTYLAVPPTINQANRDALELGLLDFQKPEQMEQWFWRQLRTYDVRVIKAGSETGTFVRAGTLNPEDGIQISIKANQNNTLQIYATDNQGQRPPLTTTLADYNPLYRDWYTNAARAGNPVWSTIEPFEGSSEVPVISCSLPIYDRADRLLGVLGVELSLSDLSQFLEAAQATTSGQSMILDRNGVLIASSSAASGLQTMGNIASRIRALDRGDRLLQAAAQHLHQQFPNLTALQDRQHLTFEEQGQRRFVQIVPWQDNLGLDWLIVNVVPEADVMGQVNANHQTTLGLCGLALVGAIASAFLTTRWIVQPIQRLSLSAEALSQGIWETPTDTWRQNEVGYLARAFQHMAQQLQDSLTQLEQNVKARTADLATAKTLHRNLLQTLPDLMAHLDHHGTYLDFKPAETFPTVITQADVIGRTIFEVLPPDLAEQRMQGLRQALQTGEVQYQEYRQCVQGEVRYEESRIVPIGSDQVLVLVRDITDRKQTEKEMELLLTVTQGINASDSFETALTVTLRGICEVTGWFYGEVWVPTPDGKALECHPAWHLNEEVLGEEQIQAWQDFRYYSEGLTLLAGQGLPTRVWQEQRAVWISEFDPTSEALSLRESLAQECGLKAGAGLPILTQQGKVLAVLVFWTGASQEQPHSAIHLASAVTMQLGTVLQNKQIEAKLAGLFAAMRDVILVFDSHGYCLEVVATNPDLLYPLPHEQVGKNLWDLLPADQASQFCRCIWDALKQNQTTAIEYSLHLHGQERWFAAQISPISEHTVIWVARDVTERKLSEAVLRQREADLAQTSRFLDSIIETMPLAVFAKDVRDNFRYVLWNRAAEEIYGIDRQEAIGRTLHELANPEVADAIALEHQSLVENRQLVITDEIFQSGFKREIWQRIRKLPIVDNQDQVSHLLYIAEDVTEYKRLEAELKQAEEKYRSIVENAIDGIFQTTPDGHYLSANLALAKIYGYDSPEELMTTINHSYQLYVNPEDRDRFIAEIQPMGVVCHFEVQIYRKDGSQIWIEENAREVRDAQGNLLYYEGIVTDITRRRQAEIALRLEKEKSERLLLNILPEPIADRLKRDNSAIAESFEEVSILFADIVDFTSLSAQMQPIQLVSLLNRLFSEFDQLVDQYQLEKIKTIGDAYMVAAGLPIPREDHADAIVQLALAMQSTIQNFATETPSPLQIRIGINSGIVVAGVIGTKKFIYDLWGDTVNIASRMESQGAAGKIQVTEATYVRLRDRYNFTPRGRIAIKGRGTMATYWL